MFEQLKVYNDFKDILTVEDFVDVDEDLATNAIYMDTEIIKEVTATQEELIEVDVTEVDMESESSTSVTYDAVSALQVVQSYFESCSLSDNEGVFSNLSNIEESELKVSGCTECH